MNERLPDKENFETIFTDFDGSLAQKNHTTLKGTDQYFGKIIRKGGRVIALTNRSPEACHTDERIFENFGAKGKWRNKNDKDSDFALAAASGAIFLDGNFNLISENSTFLTLVQRRLITEALTEYMSEISLVEWIERDSDKNLVTKIKKTQPITRFRRNIYEDRVRKYHIMYEQEDEENEIRQRSRNNKKESEHVVRQKEQKFDIRSVHITEYMRKAPRNWFLRRTNFIAKPKDIFRHLRDNKKIISKIIIGFKTKNPEKLEKLQIKFGERLLQGNNKMIVEPDLSNLHIMNERDKSIAINILINELGISLEKAIMIGNSGIDIPPGILVAKHNGRFIYVGKANESKRKMKKRFLQELNHPLLRKHYLRLERKTVDDLIEKGRIIFHDPAEDLNKI